MNRLCRRAPTAATKWAGYKSTACVLERKDSLWTREST